MSPGLKRKAIEHRGDLRVRILALDLDVDLAHAVAVAFLDVVDQIELAGLFEEPRVGLDVGEHVADAAVLVGHHVTVGCPSWPG